MSGVIAGGWEFVVAAYAVSAAILGLYAASVFLRLRHEKAHAAKDAERGVPG